MSGVPMRSLPVTGNPGSDLAGWTLAWMDPERDLDDILELDRLSFATPWTRAMYEQELRNTELSRICVLRSPAGRLDGYCSFWLIFDEVHLNNVAIRPDRRGRGLGAALVRHVLHEGGLLGARKATLEVRRSNAAARRLYARLGFQEAGVRRNYYTEPVEDALVLWCHDLPARHLDLRNLERNPDA